jgi:DNA adenine methylase
MKAKPLFIWAGGKTKVIKNYIQYMPTTINTYSEPFFGGGAMFLYVKERYSPKTVYINDIYDGITNIYNAVKNDVENFCKIVDQYEKTYLVLSKDKRKEYFYEVRHKHAFEYQNWDKTYEAATLYFLMKTGFNGILQLNKNTNNRYGTPCGLLSQKDKIYEKGNVFLWNKYLENVEILCGDYKDCPLGSFTFLDPPYRNSFTTYGSNWDDTATEELITHIKTKITDKFFLCNRDDYSRFFESRMSEYNIIKFPITYTAGRRKKTDDGFEAKKAVELLIYN